MVNCPKCGTPNADEASVCLACGAPLAGQKFAQALDAAQPEEEVSAPSVQSLAAQAQRDASRTSAAPQAAAPTPATPPASAPAAGADPAAAAAAAPAAAGAGAAAAPPAAGAPAAAPGTSDAAPLGGGYGGEMGLGLGDPSGLGAGQLSPGHAQAEIDRFVKAQAARKTRKRLTYGIVFAVVAGGLAFYTVISNKREQRRQAAAKFLKKFTAVDNGAIAGFWRCTVRAKHADIHLARDNLVLMDGLNRAFQAFPEEQPGYISRKCLPLLAAAKQELEKLDPPEDFAGPTKEFSKQLDGIDKAFRKYIERMKEAQQRAVNEKKILEANQAFHDASQSKPSQSVGYVNMMLCAVPSLRKMVKKIKKAPDVQPLVEFMFEQCKADPTLFSDRFRRTCIKQLNSVERPRIYKRIYNKMSGDPRDGSALRDCFKKANRGFFRRRLEAVGKAWVEYRNAHKQVLNKVSAYKTDEE